MATTNLCKSYVDFLNVSALKYLEVHDRAYTNDICVYALSAKRDINDNTKIDSYAFNNSPSASISVLLKLLIGIITSDLLSQILLSLCAISSNCQT